MTKLMKLNLSFK